MSDRRFSRPSALLAAAMFGLPVAAAAVCVAVVTAAMTVNGVVVSPNLPVAPAGCKGDLGWTAVAGRKFRQIGGESARPEDVPTIFLAAYGAPTIQTFYVGIHVPKDLGMERDDRLTLYFDANNSNTLNTGDFALVYDVGRNTLINSSESCDSMPGQVQKYTYDEAQTDPTKKWALVTTPLGTSVTSRFAFDYVSSAPDPESQLWELEIKLDVNALGLSTAGFKMGAKLYVHDGADGCDGLGSFTQSWTWPETLTSEGDPCFYPPGDGNVTPATMEAVSFVNCADVVIEEITATDPYGNVNHFRRPLPGDWSASGQLPLSLQNHFTARVRFNNPADPSDNSPLGIPNAGNVQFFIRPWGTGGFLDERLMRNEAVSFNKLDDVYTVHAWWPVNRATDYPSTFETVMKNSNHACLKVQLGGFTLNLNPASDVQYGNLTYTSLSTRVDTFVVTTRTPQFREVTGETEFILRAGWKNVPTNALKDWKYRIVNADSLGLKDLGGGNFHFVMGPGQDRLIVLEMTGGPTLPVPAQEFSLDPRAGGTLLDPNDGTAPLQIQVKQGQVVTILAQGQIRVLSDSVFNGANGRPDREFGTRPFLLNNRSYAFYQHIGALVGSFDRFQSGFVVGANKSFIVPAGATALYLAVNDMAGQYNDNRDGTFKLYVFISDPPTFPMQYVAPPTSGHGQPAALEPAANLPQLEVNVFRAIPHKPHPGQQPPPKDARWLAPHSYVAYAVYHTDGKPGEVTPPSDGCGSKNPRNAALFMGTSMLGILVVSRTRKRP